MPRLGDHKIAASLWLVNGMLKKLKMHLSLCEGKQTKDGRYLLSLLLPKWKGASGIRQLICCIRRFQRLGLYARCFLLITLAFFFLAVYHFFPLIFSYGWVPPDTCLALDCELQDPLPLSKLSPNLLLVLIHARAKDKNVRDSIRETWLSALNNGVNSPIQYRFVLGGKAVSDEVTEKITIEANEYKDMLIFPTVTDRKASLTNRTLFSFKYAYESFKYKYVLKCDDDSYVDLARIATELQLRKSATPLYWGYMRGNSSVLTYGLYGERSWDICDGYLTYALGGGYILSRELTKILAENAEYLKLYTCEDVSMGVWLAPYNIELKHDARFNTNSPSRGCKDPYLISHKVTAERMVAYHESLVLEGKMCSWRTYSWGPSGYIYNWTEPNTCCRKNSFVP